MNTKIGSTSQRDIPRWQMATIKNSVSSSSSISKRHGAECWHHRKVLLALLHPSPHLFYFINSRLVQPPERVEPQHRGALCIAFTLGATPGLVSEHFLCSFILRGLPLHNVYFRSRPFPLTPSTKRTYLWGFPSSRRIWSFVSFSVPYFYIQWSDSENDVGNYVNVRVGKHSANLPFYFSCTFSPVLMNWPDVGAWVS